MFENVVNQFGGMLTMLFILTIAIMFGFLYLIKDYLDDKDLDDSQNSLVDNITNWTYFMMFSIAIFIVMFVAFTGTYNSQSRKSKIISTIAFFSTVFFIVSLIAICIIIFDANKKGTLNGINSFNSLDSDELQNFSNHDFSLFISITVYCSYVIFAFSLVAITTETILGLRLARNYHKKNDANKETTFNK